ncbi:MAG TPA: hypothetical protein VN886_20285 [Acidimicrobiales bacterium]|nr:hypothetical protein [Acidimicrobiales bacterium]
MSDHDDVGTISSLEGLFLSREFGHSEEIDSPTWLDELWLAANSYDPEPQFKTGPLEEVFLSRDFGQPLADDDEEGTMDPEGPGATVLAFTPRDASARQRAVAAISGVAATVLVVAGVASGSGHPNSPGAPQVQAQAAAPAGKGSGTAPASAAPSPSPSSTPAFAANDLGTQPAVLTSATGPVPQVAVATPAGTTGTTGTTGTIVPTTPATGTGGAPAPTPPPSTNTDPFSAVVVVAGNTVAAAGTTVSTTASQVGTAVPPASSLTGVLGGVGATVSGLGQMLASTSA